MTQEINLKKFLKDNPQEARVVKSKGVCNPTDIYKATIEETCKEKGISVKDFSKVFEGNRNKYKIDNSSTDNYVTFSVSARYKKKPKLSLPNSWIKKTKSGYIVIEASFGWDWTGSMSKLNWDELKAGHNLLEYIDEDDPDLVEATILNYVD